MARWTINPGEVEHFSEVSTVVSGIMVGPVTVTLKNGTVIAGHMSGFSINNNHPDVYGTGEPPAYSGSLTVVREGEAIEVDLLDIASIAKAVQH